MTSAAAMQRESKGDRTRRRLLEIAIRRFAADGFRRTSVSDIARDVGITPATTYAYFAGKEALFDAAVDADAASLIETAREQMRGTSVRDRWLPWTGALIAALPDHPLAARVLSGKERETVQRLLDIPSLQEVRRQLAADLRAGQATGEIRADIQPDVLAEGIETVVLSVLVAYTQVGAAADSRGPGLAAVLEAALRAP